MLAKLIEAAMWLAVAVALAIALRGSTSFERGYQQGYVDAMQQRDAVDLRRVEDDIEFRSARQ